jgi:hypothetical protein
MIGNKSNGHTDIFKSFTYDSYKKLLELLASKNVNLCFADFPLSVDYDRYFILRHDVDYSPEASLRMAEIEAEMGVRASYFVLFSSPYYNLFSDEYCAIPRKLIELGHDVGLHYDSSILLMLEMGNPVDYFSKQIEMLTQLTGKKVKTIAMHNASFYKDDPLKNIGLVNAYAGQYTKEIAYFSDSCGAWRNEAVQAFNTGNIPARLQILIHPFFWGEQQADRYLRLDEYRKRIISRLDAYISKVEKIWTEHEGVIEHDKRNKIA